MKEKKIAVNLRVFPRCSQTRWLNNFPFPGMCFVGQVQKLAQCTRTWAELFWDHCWSRSDIFRFLCAALPVYSPDNRRRCVKYLNHNRQVRAQRFVRQVNATVIHLFRCDSLAPDIPLLCVPILCNALSMSLMSRFNAVALSVIVLKV